MSFWLMMLLASYIAETTSAVAVIFTPSTDYVEGTNVNLSCKATYTTDTTYWSIIRRNSKTTISIGCKDRGRFERVHLKKENCDPVAGWYNLTIEKIAFEDRGMYDCMSGHNVWKYITVYVYQQSSPKLIKVGDNVTSDAETGTETLDLKPSENGETREVELYCVTDCGYPAPSIKWYGLREDGSQEHFTEKNDITKLETTSTECYDGLSRSESNLTLIAQYKDPHAAVQDITCEAGQDFTQYQGKLLIKTAVLKVEYGATYTMSAATTAGIVIAVIIPVGVLIGFGVWYRRHWRQKRNKKASANFMEMERAGDQLLPCRNFLHDYIILKITMGENTPTEIKNSLIPPNLAGAEDNLCRFINVHRIDGKIPPIIIGRGKYKEGDEEKYILKLPDSTDFVSRKHLEIIVYDRTIRLKNVGVYPVGLRDGGTAAMSVIANGGIREVRQNDCICLHDADKTCLRITYNLFETESQPPSLTLEVNPEDV